MTFNVKNYLPDFTSEEDVKKSFRNNLRDYFKCRHVSIVSNGTAAIEVAFKALGLKRGTGVIVPDISFIATATAVANCGLLPVYADVSEQYFGLTLETVKAKYTEEIGAVVLVHFAGYINREIFEIKKFCEEKGIYLVEDCAQVFVCSINGKKAGTIGDIGTFSLQTSKIVNCGEGGIITTNSEELGRKIESISNWGLYISEEDRDLSLPSSNYRLSAYQCYFAQKQLDMLEEIIDERLNRISEFEELCQKYSLKTANPPKQPNIVDCPFFFVLKNVTKIHTLAPVGEYPMRNSVLVRSILSFNPDLLEKYIRLNGDIHSERASDRLVKQNDFINIHQSYATSCEEMLEKYKQIEYAI